MGYIYRITNTINGKSYIGESKQLDIKKRWSNHIKSLETKNGSTALIGAFEKYGIENFKFEVIIICFDDDRLFYEVEYMKKFNTLVPNGYNISEGRLKLDNFNSKSFNEFLNKKKTQAIVFKEKVKNYSVSIREKMENSEKWQKALAEKRCGNNNNRKHTEEGKQKISESVKSYFRNNGKSDINVEKHREAMAKSKGKEIEQYSLDNEFIQKFASMSMAARETELPRITIQLNLYGQAEKGGNYIWKYVQK